jgi:hypothetical protein
MSYVDGQQVVRGLAYCETGLATSYAQTLRRLHTVGRSPWPVHA